MAAVEHHICPGLLRTGPEHGGNFIDPQTLMLQVVKPKHSGQYQDNGKCPGCEMGAKN